MKRGVFYIVLVVFLSSFIQSEGVYVYPVVKNESFEVGEELEYKMTFSFFNVGTGKFIIRDQIYNFDERPSYKIDVYGKTSGFVNWLAHVDDHWGAYIDTSALLPHRTFRNIKEGKYRRNEIVNFDHETSMIEVKVLDQKTRKYKPPKYFYHPEQKVFDMFGGMLYFRTLDFRRYSEGDTLRVDAFFEDTFYKFNTIYVGKEVIKTKVGKFRAIVLMPVMPDNDLFRGENSIRIWISDDKNRIPLKVEAEMFIGSAGVEITSFKGLKNPISSYVLGSR